MKYFTVEGKPHLCLFAVRDISPGEEITYNYGDSDWPWRCKVVNIFDSAHKGNALIIENFMHINYCILFI